MSFQIIKKYLFLYWCLFKQHTKVMLEYRGDFFVGVLSTFVIQGSSILFVTILFEHIYAINGWTRDQILFIYSIALTGRAIEMIFFDNLWTVGWQYIRTGGLDRILVRPINPLFQIIADRVQKDGLGGLIVGIILLRMSILNLGLDWTFGNSALLAIMILSSSIIFMSINLFFATFSFWMTDSLPLMWSVHNLSEFTRYPLGIYHKVLQFILTWLIPYGFTAFYPASFFIENESTNLGILTPLIALICFTIAYLFWKKGLNSFHSSGS